MVGVVHLESGVGEGMAPEMRHRLDTLLCDLSSRFLGAHGGDIEAAVLDAVRQLGETLVLDSVGVFLFAHGRDRRPSLIWTAPGVAPPSPRAWTIQALPWTLRTIRAGEVVSFSLAADIPDKTDSATYHQLGTTSNVTVPLVGTGGVEGAMTFETRGAVRQWSPEIIDSLRLFANLVAGALAHRGGKRVPGKAAAMNAPPVPGDSEQEDSPRDASDMVDTNLVVVGQSASLRRVVTQVEQVAATDATVLLLGETGTGKELLASHLHETSARQGRAMVRVNCAAIPASLVESELFGREKGAYTGALSKQIGRFELAHGSTIFLDEIGDLPAEVQVKLLRVLENKFIERLGSPHRIPIDVRIIAATHRDLEKHIADGTFREDLFYRLNVFPIKVPPLRDRVEDIPLLARRFVDEFSKAFGKRIDAIASDSLDALKRYHWPGNIRELRNVVERAMIAATGRRLTIVPPAVAGMGLPRSLKLVDVERQHILSVLELTRWRIRGEHGAAAHLGMKPTTLETRMAKLGLHRSHATR